MGIHLVALWNPKAASWKNGRKNWKNQVENFSLISNQSFTIWMHCASLGEFEQGRPVLEALRKKHPKAHIILTFFSPSGYEIRKNYSGADLVMYLPLDTQKNAQFFLDKVKPQLVLWVKYEYWYHFLTQVKKRAIPLLMISGIYRKNQAFFKPWGRLHRYILDSFTHFFVQNDHSKTLLSKINIPIEKITVTNDTRFDRVVSIAENAQKFPIIEDFCKNKQVIVAGSTWEADEEILSHSINYNPSLGAIIAPHEIDEDHLKDIEKLFQHSIRYSALVANPSQATNANTLIIDNIGMLSSLYQYAKITYIGGGFNQSGIHNTLEAAVYGKPVIFGEVYQKFAEAVSMVDQEIAFSVSTALELEQLIQKLLKNETLYQQICDKAYHYVQSQTGATQLILDYIIENDVLPTDKKIG